MSTSALDAVFAGLCDGPVEFAALGLVRHRAVMHDGEPARNGRGGPQMHVRPQGQRSPITA